MSIKPTSTIASSVMLPLAVLAIAGAVTPASASSTPTKDHVLTVLHAFAGGTDGANPNTTMVADKAGNLYGTTYNGCTDGSVYKIAPNGTETVLYCFTGTPGSGNPGGGLMIDKLGNLYGTTESGGDNDAGTVYKIAADGTFTLLYSFLDGTQGGVPIGSLVLYKKDLYGTVFSGGANGQGAVFKLTPNGKETILYSFTGGTDGGEPYAGLVVDKAGNLYGTTNNGGDPTCSCGTVYEITPSGQETTLHDFVGGTDGSSPGEPHLILSTAGDLYGVTSAGGNSNNGTIYKIAANGTESVLYAFTGGDDGKVPVSRLLLGSTGTLFGTTYEGGADGFGTVFKLTPNNKLRVMYTFTGGLDGCYSAAGLVDDAAFQKGYLYGAAADCGANGDGTIFSITK